MAKVKPDRPGVNDPGPGRRMGVDVGTVRIGVALSDRDAVLAMPCETVPRAEDGSDVARLARLVQVNQVVEVVVGLPRDLKGNGSKSVQHARQLAAQLQQELESQGESIAIKLGDERLTTVVATQAMRASGRSAKKSRSVIDQAAAVEILQTWLDGRANELARRGDTP